jgi:hypothetical protein
MSAVIVGEPPRTTWMAVWRVAVWVQVPVDAEYDQ